MFSKFSIKVKLLVALLCVGIVPLAVMAIVALTKAGSALHQQAFNQLEAVRGIKKAQVEEFFEGSRGDMGVLVETVESLREESFAKLASIQQLKKAHVEEFFTRVHNDISSLAKSEDLLRMYLELRDYHSMMHTGHDEPYDTSTEQYKEIYEEHSLYFNNYVETYGYYDMFLICAPHGHVMYTAAQEADIGTNLGHGPYKNESLAHLWKEVVRTRKVVIEDFSPYTPSNGQQAAFIGAPLYDHAGELLGMVALQIPTDPINAIVQKREGMGVSGETYLMGRNKGKTAFRSDMKTMGGGKYSIGYEITTPYIDKALNGHEGEEVFTDSAGKLVVVAYNPLHIKGLNWACISKIDLEEAIVHKGAEDNKDFFAKYIEKYGYYDLFLIHPEGKVFYSVTHEADYGTNMVDGKYSDSGLGRLTRRVLETKQYGVADFAPYAPSNDEPAAFIAQPIVHHGETQLIVALQISLDAINAIMTQRDGMGKTGESYLIGADTLMRSDSFLDPENHSVKASFANPEKGKVDTEASREALSGKTDSRIVRDYNGNWVLSAYTPLQLAGVQWALLAEIDKAEAFSAVEVLVWAAAVVGAIVLTIVIILAFLITRSIVQPVQGVVDNLTELAQGEGDLTSRLTVDSEDEIGKLAERFNEFMDKLHTMIKDISKGVDTLSSSSTELSAISEQMSTNAEQTSIKSNTVATATEEMSTNMGSVSAAMEQSSTNTNMVASASEEMTATITEIAQNAENARSISGQAVHKTKDAGDQMTELGRAAQAIGTVTETIAEISEQTNLLALNATIEAARAGEAGKGFAVVANEIKELAKQTAEATQDIKQQIDGVQGATGNTVESIKEIGKVIDDVNEIVATIATAVEEQSVSTKEIADNIAQVSSGIGEVNENVAQSSQVAGEITRDITEVNQASQEMAESSSQVRLSADELSQLAEELNLMVGRFKV